MNASTAAQTIASKSSGDIPVLKGDSSTLLYEHQKKAMHCLDRLNELPSFSTLVVLPTGAGKTKTATVWLLQNAIDKGKKVLWIAHRQLLLEQAAEAFQKNALSTYLPRISSFRFRIVSGATGHCMATQIRADDNLLVAGKDSLGQNLDNLRVWLKGENEVFVVVDEAHHATAKTYRRILDFVAKRVPNMKLIGLTATPMRTAKEEAGLLGKLFRDGVRNGRVVRNEVGIAYQISLKELIAKQILARPRIVERNTDSDFSQLGHDALERIQRLDAIPEAIAESMAKNAGRNQMIVDTYSANRKEFGQTIVFALRTNQAYHLRKLFEEKGIKAGVVVSGEHDGGTGASTSPKQNDLTIAAFREGKLDVLVNVNILTEGADLPRTKTVFLTRPTVSKILMTQMVGRALRGEKAGGNREANIVVFIDNWEDNINWVNPESVFGTEDCEFDDTPRDRLKRTIRWISIAKIEEFAKMLNQSIDTSALERVPFLQRIPVGMYVFSYLEARDGVEEGADCQAQVMVYDSTRKAYERMMSALPDLFRRHRATEEEYLSKSLLEAMCEECHAHFFMNDMIPPYDRVDVERILKYYAQKEEAPPYYPFEDIDRAALDISKVARKIIDEDMGQRREAEYLNGLWEDGDNNLFRLFFTRKSYFLFQVQIEENKLMHPEIYEPDDARFVPDRVPLEDLPLYEMRQNAPERAKQLADAAFAAARNDNGDYVCQKCGRIFKTRRGLHVDHIVPRLRGGKTVPENLQVLCAACNLKKGAK